MKSVQIIDVRKRLAFNTVLESAFTGFNSLFLCIFSDSEFVESFVLRGLPELKARKLFLKKFLILAIILNSIHLYSQNIEVVKFEKLQSKFKNKSDTTYIVNFFASWCGPCIAELPSIVKFSKENKNTKYKVILVSLDFKKNYLEVLPNLIEKYQISQTIYLLDESDSNNWIGKLDKNWSGQIPATFITNGSTKEKKLITDKLNFDTIKNK